MSLFLYFPELQQEGAAIASRLSAAIFVINSVPALGLLAFGGLRWATTLALLGLIAALAASVCIRYAAFIAPNVYACGSTALIVEFLALAALCPQIFLSRRVRRNPIVALHDKLHRIGAPKRTA